MRYFDRKLFVVEHLLVKHLPTGYDYDTEGSVRDLEKEQGRMLIQKGVLNEIFESLEIIVSDKYDMASFFPEEILQAVNDKSLRDKEQIHLRDWIRNCGQMFSQSIEQWKHVVDENMSYLPLSKLNCFKKADPNIFPAKVNLYIDDNGVLCLIPDNNPWGEVIFEFPGADIPGLNQKLCEGWLMWSEIERLEDYFEFNFLLNTEVGEILSMESIMRDKNWIEFKVRCKNPGIKVINYDYANRWSETGCQSLKIFLESCRALLMKSKDLGTLYLNEKERELLYIAELYDCFSSSVNPEITGTNPVDTLKLQEFIDNQYGFQQTLSIINETGDIELVDALNNLKKYGEKKSIKKDAPECKRLLNIMEDRDKSSLGRLFYKNLAQLMIDAAAEYDRDWNGRNNFIKTRNTIINKIELLIIKMGFAGEFPHYKRISKNIGEYITFFSVNHGLSYFTDMYMQKSGCVKISILVGRAPLTILASDYFVSGLPFEKSNAWDCTWEKQKCRTVCIGPSDDEGWFEFNYDDGISSESDIEERAADMIPYMEVVNCTLKNKPLPKFYLKHHREYLKRNKTAKKLMGIIVLGGLFFSSAMWVLSTFILPLIFNNGARKGFDMGNLFIALGCGVFFGVVMGGYILYDIRRKAWPS